MKKFMLILWVAMALCSYGTNAQVNVQVNLGLQPDWGPTGYDYVNYYYLPDIDAYYDVPHRQYVYMENNYWVTRPYLPVRYRNYDLYRGYKVVINEPRPWVYHDRYRGQYMQYRGRGGQPFLRDVRGEVHHDNGWHNGHREDHGNWHGDRGHYDGGHGNWHGDNGHHGEGHGPGGHGPGGPGRGHR